MPLYGDISVGQTRLSNDRFVDSKYVSVPREENYWITAIPATFMSAVSMTYFFCADECLGFSTAVAYPAGIILAALFLGIFIWSTRKPARKQA